MRIATTILLLVLLLLAHSVLAEEPALATAPFASTEAKSHQQAWAKQLKTTVQIKNSIGMRFQLIPPGKFTMGSPNSEEWHQEPEVVHRVTITQAFYMAATEVTQGQWQAIMGKNPSFFVGDDLPVETITWKDAQTFCHKLSEKEGIEYRLPTEAEWEYSCRAGTTTPFYTGKTITTDQANYDGNYTYGRGPKGVFRETTTAVGRFAPNAWGLHDMHGNVWEWCADWYGEYTAGKVQHPRGPAKGNRRVFRGGCWINFPAVCRSANRAKVAPVSWNFHLGVRVVCALAQK